MSSKSIHKILIEKHPEHVAKARKTFAFKYFKILIFLFCISVAYIIFTNGLTQKFIYNLGDFGYFGDFIAGMLLVPGFFTPFAIGFLIISNPANVFLSALIVAFGAVIIDCLIFVSIKKIFRKEIKDFHKNKTVEKINNELLKDFGTKATHYLLYVFAGLIIATPLPDEIGVSMLAGLTHIKLIPLIIISFVLHFLAVLILLLI